MREPDATFTITDSSSQTTTTQDAVYPAEPEEGCPVNRLARTRYAGILPAVAMSIFFSAASVIIDPRTVFADESSVRLSSQRLSRRRISLAEARQIALDVLQLAEFRRGKFAELEGAQFISLYGWSVE